LYSLPFDIVSSIVRYVAEILIPERKSLLIPTIIEAKKYVRATEKIKQDFIKRLRKIVHGEHNILSVSVAQQLVNMRAFSEDKAVHNGVLEYLMRMLNDRKTHTRLVEKFGKEMPRDLKKQIFQHSNYVNYLRNIKDGTVKPFFTKDGLENDHRTPTFSEAVDEYFYPELVAKRKSDDFVAKQGMVTAPPADLTPESGEAGNEFVVPTENDLESQESGSIEDSTGENKVEIPV